MRASAQRERRSGVDAVLERARGRARAPARPPRGRPRPRPPPSSRRPSISAAPSPSSASRAARRADRVEPLGELLAHPGRDVAGVVVGGVAVHPHRERLDRLRALARRAPARPRRARSRAPRSRPSRRHAPPGSTSRRRCAARCSCSPSGGPRGSSTSTGSTGSRRRPGTFQTAARLSPSCVSPTEKAPSPRNVIATRGSPRRLKASAAPATTGTRSPSIETSGKTPSRRRAEVQVAVAAERRARRLAEEVAEHVGGRRAAREVAGELAVQRRDDVVGPEREPRPGRDRLLAAARVDGAGHPSLPVQGHHPVLEQPLQEDEPEERDALVAADGLEPGARFYRHVRSIGISRRGGPREPRRSSRPTGGRRPRAPGANGTGVSGGGMQGGGRVEVLERAAGEQREDRRRRHLSSGPLPAARARVRSSRPRRGSASSSSGQIVRRSITSTSAPIRSAAASAVLTPEP